MKSKLWTEVPVTERLPKERDYYGVIAPKWDSGITEAFYEPGYGFKDKEFNDTDITEYVTHWLEPYELDTESPEYLTIVLATILRHADKDQIIRITHNLIQRGGLNIPTEEDIDKIANEEELVYGTITRSDDFIVGFNKCLEALNIYRDA